MFYLIGQLLPFLLVTAGFMAFVGWTWAAQQAEPTRRLMRDTRDRLVRDLGLMATGDASVEERGLETGESISHVREARIAELERALEGARSRADDAAGEADELRRQLAQAGDSAAELTRLRAFAAEQEQRRTREIETRVDPAEEDDGAEASALQAWRLRYFEQRVSYLEALPRGTAAVSAPAASDAAAQQLDWRARDAEARAAYLEQELRTLATAAPAAEAAPFAADAALDALLRWRMLYLERRMAHLQQRQAAAAAVAPAPAHDAAPDPDSWRWRARYLEARVRHLEQHPPVPAPALARPAEPEDARPNAPSPRPARSGVKPPVAASPRNGAPDDLTMIDAVTQLQQTALHSLGVFHFDQIAAWTADNVAWVDQYFRLRGRIDEEGWVEQADELARPPVLSARASEVVSP